MRVIRLGPAPRLLVPTLMIASASKRTRGLSFHLGRSGLPVGGLLVASSLALGWLLFPAAGYVGLAGVFWLIGSTGVVIGATAMRPIAFVKPICTRCRLLPVIKEHEAIHLSGVANEKEVWDSMRSRHSVQSLALEGDPAICSFCPIPGRLGGSAGSES